MSEKGLTCRNGDKHAQIGSRQVQNLQSHMVFFIYGIFFLYSTLSEVFTRTETSPLCLLPDRPNPEDSSSSWATTHTSVGGAKQSLTKHGTLCLGMELARWCRSYFRTASG